MNTTLSSLHGKCVVILSTKCPTSPLLGDPYENVEYNDVNTTAGKTRVSNVMVHLSPSVLNNMTDNVYSFRPGLLKPASLLSALGILLYWGAC